MQCGSGYDGAELAAVVVKKTALYRDSLRSVPMEINDLRSASAAIAVGLSVTGTAFNCIDFGGAAGAHFFLARKLIGESVTFCWHVVETKSMVSAAAEMNDDGLKFFSTIDEASSAFNGKIDLVFTSGALQYMPESEETLGHLTSVGARKIFINRVGLSDVKLDRRVTVQHTRLSSNGPGPLPSEFKDAMISYPITFCSKHDVERILGKRYAINISFLEERNAYSIGTASISTYGFFGSGLAERS